VQGSIIKVDFLKLIAIKLIIYIFLIIIEFIWCQEEPQNNGAYTFIEPRLNQILPNNKKVKIFVYKFFLNYLN
jgi:hypothetical protein